MDAATHARYAVRCIVVSTQSAMAGIARAYADDPVEVDRVQRATVERGVAMLARLEDDEAPMTAELAALVRAAHVALVR